jgi:methylphosphotriester-DNA--protein-cysteine methyltransferase
LGAHRIPERPGCKQTFFPHWRAPNPKRAKAKELLRDPRSRVGEAARAAGYASPDSFRHAFKAHEGLSPEHWRAGQ